MWLRVLIITTKQEDTAEGQSSSVPKARRKGSMAPLFIFTQFNQGIILFDLRQQNGCLQWVIPFKLKIKCQNFHQKVTDTYHFCTILLLQLGRGSYFLIQRYQSLCQSPHVIWLIFNLLSLQATLSCYFPARLASLLPLGAFRQALASLPGLQQCPLPGRLIQQILAWLPCASCHLSSSILWVMHFLAAQVK